MGPRSGMLLWIIAMPLIITFVVRLIFGNIIEPSPRLGVVDLGTSSIPAAIEKEGGIQLQMVDSVGRLEQLVRDNNLDAGLVLTKGFDTAVRSGQTPELRFFVGGKSLASNRIILAVTTIDLIRSIAGQPSPTKVVTEVVGSGSAIPLSERLVPLLVFFAVALGGVFVPAASIIQEREAKTIDAMLMTPVGVGDAMAAKGIFGFFVSLIVGVFTLVINTGFTAQTGAFIVVLAAAALMMVPLGLLLGAVAKDMATMFSIWKSGAIFIIAPAILFLFPSLPEWIARIFPTYYFLGPLYHMIVDSSSLSSVAGDLAISVGISLVIAAAAGAVARKMETRLAIA